MGEIVGGVAEKENPRKGKLWKTKFNQLHLRNRHRQRLLLPRLKLRLRKRSPRRPSRNNGNRSSKVPAASVAIAARVHKDRVAADKASAAAEIVPVAIEGRVPGAIAVVIGEKAAVPTLVEAAVDRDPSVALLPISSSKS
jgi:hypothetical protein